MQFTIFPNKSNGVIDNNGVMLPKQHVPNHFFQKQACTFEITNKQKSKNYLVIL